MKRTSTTLRAPQQDRSQRTLESILVATEALLAEDRLFDDIGVEEIVRRAGTSVGAFYARFSGKEALLPLLYERYDRSIPDDPAAWLPRGAEAANLRERVAQVVGVCVRLFEERRGLLRAMTMHARANPDAIGNDVRQRRRALHRALGDLLLEFRAEIGHEDPPFAVGFGLLMVAAMCREKILFGHAPHASTVAVSASRLRRELELALLCYLRGGPTPPPRAARRTTRSSKKRAKP